MGTLFMASILVAPTSGASAAPVTASDLLEELSVASEVRAGYDRSLFPHWVDDDGDGCDTRREVLIEESLVPVTRTGVCSVIAGEWYSAYDGSTWTDPAEVQIDHVVPLAEAWDSGARSWSEQTRRAFANDLVIPDALMAVTGSVNQSKSDRDPAAWMPPVEAYGCDYAVSWVRVKYRWTLSVDSNELAALRSVLSGDCGSRAVEVPPKAAVATAARVFTDVPTSHQWASQIAWLASTGVTTGYPEPGGTYTYRPTVPVARDAMAAFLYRLEGEPSYTPPTTSRFSDVPTTHPFYAEIHWLAERRITTGYPDGTFQPSRPVARDAMAAFLHRLEGGGAVNNPSSPPFTDVPVAHQFYGDIVWLAANGITTGTVTAYGCRVYQPGNVVQRGDMAAFMYRLRNGGTTPVLDGSECQPPPPPPPPLPGNPVAPNGWSCPAWAPIKGNANSGIYHVPGGQYYAATKPEQCFRSEADARAAGYRKSQR